MKTKEWGPGEESGPKGRADLVRSRGAVCPAPFRSAHRWGQEGRKGRPRVGVGAWIYIRCYQSQLQTQEESLNIKSDEIQGSRCFLGQGVAPGQRAQSNTRDCLLPHYQEKKPYPMRSWLHIKRLPALNATRDPGLDLETEKAHEWKNKKSNKVCSLVNSIVPMLLSYFWYKYTIVR